MNVFVDEVGRLASSARDINGGEVNILSLTVAAFFLPWMAAPVALGSLYRFANCDIGTPRRF
jgi:hypothetical protein